MSIHIFGDVAWYTCDPVLKMSGEIQCLPQRFAEPSTSSTHSCRGPLETGMTCPRNSLRPRPSTHLCQGPPDCSNPKRFVVVVVVVLRCWPSVKWQNSQHDDCGHFTGRRKKKKKKEEGRRRRRPQQRHSNGRAYTRTQIGKGTQRKVPAARTINTLVDLVHCRQTYLIGKSNVPFQYIPKGIFHIITKPLSVERENANLPLLPEVKIFFFSSSFLSFSWGGLSFSFLLFSPLPCFLCFCVWCFFLLFSPSFFF